MRTIETKVYTIDELENEAKEKAIQDNWDWNVSDSFWYEGVIDDAKEIGKLLGIEIENIYFSGFSSQGDGACFEGYYSYNKESVKKLKDYAPQDSELHRIAENLASVQKRYFYSITASVKHRGHYSHSGCTSIEVNDRFNENSFYSESSAIDEVSEYLRDFMDWIYKMLETDYWYLTKDEQVIESLRSNQVEFTVDGKRF